MIWVYHRDLPPSPDSYSHHDIQTAERLRELEISSKGHGERISLLEKAVWGLILTSAGMAHEKLPRLFDMVETLLRLKL